MEKATALVFPSLYEGFGIPPLEAMVHGCPVLASDIPATREVCGSAAVYFNPSDPTELRKLMNEAISAGEDWREERRRAGFQRSSRFAWRDSALIIARAC